MLDKRSDQHTAAPSQSYRLPGTIGFNEFIVLMAALTSIVAFSIDIFLPALADIGNDYQLTDDNDRQLVIVAFTVSFGIAQLFFGPLADRFGRKTLMIGSLVAPGLVLGIGIGLGFDMAGIPTNWFTSALGAQLSWTLPFGILVMFAVTYFRFFLFSSGRVCHS